MDESGKMSKSKGAVLTVSVLQEQGYDPLAYRFMCLSSHYRKPLLFSYDVLSQAQSTLNKLRSRIKDVNSDGDIENDKFDYYNERFINELSNDLNTANCITVVYDLLKDDEVNGKTKLELIKKFDEVLAIDLLKKNDIDDKLAIYVEKKIAERNLAKSNKNFELADSIRDELLQKNIRLIDSREGTRYEVI